MISVYLLKSRFQRVLSPIASWLIQKRITPNQITLFALAISIAAGLYFIGYPSYLPWISVIFLIRMGLNALDGMVARATGANSDFGCYLNEIGDIISDVALTLPFAFISQRSFLPVLMIIFLSILSEVAGILGAVVTQKRRYDGPMGKSDRAFCLSLLAIGLYYPLPESLLLISYFAIGLLISLTIILRVKNGIKSS